MPRPITVRLVGGLGNQLFGYYAGAALAAEHRVTLRVDSSWAQHGLTDHGIEIRRFRLPGEWLDSNALVPRLLGPRSIVGRATNRTLREIQPLAKISKVHHAREVGYDPTLWDQPPGTRLRGYYQSWRIVERAVQAGLPRRPELIMSSAWLDDTIKRAQRERPIVVHVRRGDYAQVREFGLLGAGYYESAIGRIRSEGVAGPIWLFSDEPDAARHALGKFAGDASSVVSPDGPATELLAMSYAAGNVIANSTFSWWAAWMGGPGRPVVAPAPWFRSGPDVAGLIPCDWKTQPSSWVD